MKVYTKSETLVKGDVTEYNGTAFVVSSNGKNERGYWHELTKIVTAYKIIQDKLSRSEQERFRALCQLEEARATIKQLDRKIQIGNYDESYVYDLQRKSRKMDCLCAELSDLFERYQLKDTQGE